MQYFKTAALRRKADCNGLVVIPAQSAIKGKKPINRVPVDNGLSALRLCVWLSNNGYIQLLYMNERFLFTFWTEQGEIP